VETIVAVAEASSGVVSGLRLAGWRVRLAVPGTEADAIAVLSPDALIVDLPHGDALVRFVDEVSGTSALDGIPLIVALDTADLRAVAAHRRIDDFVMRPVRADELGARIRRRLRPRAVPVSDDGVWSSGPLQVDLKRFEASLDGHPLEFTYQEFQLLRFLVANPEQAFTRDQLLARVWGWDYFGGPRTVDIHVRRVRAKLGEPCADWIETVRNVGYRWTPRALTSTNPVGGARWQEGNDV
jgi:DNA-binding response OmpR family regulator